MVRLSYLLIAAVAAAGMSSAWADCQYPKEKVKVPDGATATEAEMVQGKGDIKQYLGKMEDYLKCLDKEQAQKEKSLLKSASAKSSDKEEAAAIEGQIKKDRAMRDKRHNAAVDAMQQVAAQFNEQVRAYNKAQGAN